MSSAQNYQLSRDFIPKMDTTTEADDSFQNSPRNNKSNNPTEAYGLNRGPRQPGYLLQTNSVISEVSPQIEEYSSATRSKQKEQTPSMEIGLLAFPTGPFAMGSTPSGQAQGSSKISSGQLISADPSQKQLLADNIHIQDGVRLESAEHINPTGAWPSKEGAFHFDSPADDPEQQPEIFESELAHNRDSNPLNSNFHQSETIMMRPSNLSQQVPEAKEKEGSRFQENFGMMDNGGGHARTPRETKNNEEEEKASPETEMTLSSPGHYYHRFNQVRKKRMNLKQNQDLTISQLQRSIEKYRNEISSLTRDGEDSERSKMFEGAMRETRSRYDKQIAILSQQNEILTKQLGEASERLDQQKKTSQAIYQALKQKLNERNEAIERMSILSRSSPFKNADSVKVSVDLSTKTKYETVDESMLLQKDRLVSDLELDIQDMKEVYTKKIASLSDEIFSLKKTVAQQSETILQKDMEMKTLTGNISKMKSQLSALERMQSRESFRKQTISNAQVKDLENEVSDLKARLEESLAIGLERLDIIKELRQQSEEGDMKQINISQATNSILQQSNMSNLEMRMIQFRRHSQYRNSTKNLLKQAISAQDLNNTTSIRFDASSEGGGSPPKRGGVHVNTSGMSRRLSNDFSESSRGAQSNNRNINIFVKVQDQSKSQKFNTMINQIRLENCDYETKYNKLSQVVAQLRSEFQRLQHKFHDLQKSSQDKIAKLKKQVEFEKKKRIDIQESKVQVRSDLLMQIEERDKKNQKLMQEIMFQNSRDYDLLSMSQAPNISRVESHSKIIRQGSNESTLSRQRTNSIPQNQKIFKRKFQDQPPESYRKMTTTPKEQRMQTLELPPEATALNFDNESKIEQTPSSNPYISIKPTAGYTPRIVTSSPSKKQKPLSPTRHTTKAAKAKPFIFGKKDSAVTAARPTSRNQIQPYLNKAKKIMTGVGNTSKATTTTVKPKVTVSRFVDLENGQQSNDLIQILSEMETPSKIDGRLNAIARDFQSHAEPDKNFFTTQRTLRSSSNESTLSKGTGVRVHSRNSDVKKKTVKQIQINLDKKKPSIDSTSPFRQRSSSRTSSLIGPPSTAAKPTRASILRAQAVSRMMTSQQKTKKYRV